MSGISSYGAPPVKTSLQTSILKPERKGHVAMPSAAPARPPWGLRRESYFDGRGACILKGQEGSCL